MNESERHRLTLAYCRDHETEWAAYLAKPLAEREAITAKVEAVTQQHGILAGRDMMRALGMPMVPDELCDPVEELEARRAADPDGQQWMRETAAELGMAPEEIEEMMAADSAAGRLDH